MTLTISEWNDADFDEWAALRMALEPNVAIEHLRRIASGQVVTFLHRSIARIDGRLVGAAQVAIPPVSPTPNVQVQVAKDHRSAGIGRRLVQAALAGRDHDELGTMVDDDDPRDLAFAERYGFAVVNHGITSRLDAADVVITDVVCEYPIAVIPDAELSEDQVLAIDSLTARAATNPETVQLGWTTGVAEFRKMLPNIEWVVAWDGNRAIGMASTQPRVEKDWLVVYTCVDPQYRNRGLSRALKQTLHSYGVSNGAAGFDTQNEESNVEIRGLNTSLGYTKIGGQYRLLRRPASE